MKSSIVFFPALCLFFLSTPSHAEERLPFKPTETELLALPDYCRAKFSGNADIQKPWILKMGKANYSHLHHYCSGLVYVNRIGPASRSKHKKHYIQTGLAQFNYVLRNWPDDFYLKKEAKAYKSQLEFQLNMK